jgi:hypothetical protein
VFDRLIEFAQGEYDYLRGRDGRGFFLALAPYVNALQGRPRIGVVIAELEEETREATERTLAEQNALVDEARAIRVDLARRAPEIDNSDMTPPDEVRSDAWMTYDLDSFARFDELANAELRIAYPSMPDNSGNPGPVSDLLVILRGRLFAAECGEDGSINAPKIRNDLDDVGREIGNLARRYESARGRYRQDVRTLPGLAFGRLVYFGSDLTPEATIIETDEDAVHALDQILREFGSPKRVVQKLVGEQRLEEWEGRFAAEVEGTLKEEAERLHRELVRRLSEAPENEEVAPVQVADRRRFSSVVDFVRKEPLIVTVVGGLIVVLIAFYLFGIGN